MSQQSQLQQQQQKRKTPNMLERLSLRPKKAEQEDFDDFDSVTSSEIDTVSNKSAETRLNNRINSAVSLNKLTVPTGVAARSASPSLSNRNNDANRPVAAELRLEIPTSDSSGFLTESLNKSQPAAVVTSRPPTPARPRNETSTSNTIAAGSPPPVSASGTQQQQPKIISSLNKSMSNSLSRLLVRGRSASARKQNPNTSQTKTAANTNEPDDELDQMDVREFFFFYYFKIIFTLWLNFNS